mgnify:CR=1 FL=1
MPIMSDANDGQPQTQKPDETISLPPQESATDTSNWDDREFTTPSGRVVIETNQDDGDSEIVAE